LQFSALAKCTFGLSDVPRQIDWVVELAGPALFEDSASTNHFGRLVGSALESFSEWTPAADRRARNAVEAMKCFLTAPE
jgi:hypothetical protein